MNSDVYLERSARGDKSLSAESKEIAQALDGIIYAEMERRESVNRRLRSQVASIRIVLALVGFGLIAWTLEGAVGIVEQVAGVVMAILVFLAFAAMDSLGRLRLASDWEQYNQQIRPDVEHILIAHPEFLDAVRQVPRYNSLVTMVDFVMTNSANRREAHLGAERCSPAEHYANLRKGRTK